MEDHPKTADENKEVIKIEL